MVMLIVYIWVSLHSPFNAECNDITHAWIRAILLLRRKIVLIIDLAEELIGFDEVYSLDFLIIDSNGSTGNLLKYYITFRCEDAAVSRCIISR
jgi:hypothetical protein